MTDIVSLIDNKLLKLSNETIPLVAISSISANYEIPNKVFSILLVLIGGIIIANGGVWGLFIIAIGIAKLCIRRHFLLVNLHSARTVRLDMPKQRPMFEAQREIENALLGLPTEVVALSPAGATTLNQATGHRP
jgi:hypothetical protein